MNREPTPAFKWFAAFSLALAVLLAGFENVSAAQLSSQRGAAPAKSSKFIKLAQSITGQTKIPGTNSRIPPVTTPPPTGGKKPPGNRRPPGGGGKIIIDIGKLFPPPGTYRPTYPPPKRVYKPKPPVRKVYKPKPKPKRTVRRPTPRAPVRPPVLAIQPIPQFIADQATVLVRNQPQDVDAALAQAFGLTVISSTPIALLDGRMVTFRVPTGRPLPQVIAALTADPRVEMAQPNNIYLTVQQRARKATSFAQYTLAKLGLGTAHRISQGRGIPVAVIDTGVDASHPVLANSVGQSFDAVARGKAEVDEHGTAIAGLIAGQGKVTGVAPAANLLAVRAFYIDAKYRRPMTSTDVLIRAFDWAYTNGARVFNMSFTGPFDPMVQTALSQAHTKGVILVAAAGNGGPKAPPAYPAAYKDVIAITATDRQDRLYAHANRGGYLAVAAPGVDVLVPTLRKGYKFSSGTSMAAAHISGMVALLLEKNPRASSAEVLRAIQSTARDLGPKGHDIQFGAGRADAHASLLSLPAGQVKLTSGQ